MGEMSWLNIGWALLLGAMLVMIWPRARIMMKEGRQGSSAEWMSALIPLLLVIGFVALLILSV
jgi:TRAP-type C4-dicarboxylate transport system permease small subunit